MNNRMNPVGLVIIGLIVLIVVALLIAFWPSSAAAQSATSGANSNSSASLSNESSSQAQSQGGQSYAQGGNLTINTPASTSTQSKTTVKNTGTYTLRSAPPVQAPSMGSGHPCGLGGSIGVSIIGGGAAGGATQVDEACLLAQMGQGEAALIMIARRDSEACAALRQVGRIPPNSVCNSAERRAAEKRAEATASSPQPAPRPDFRCVPTQRDGRTVVQAMYPQGADPAAAVAFCRAQR